MSYLKQKRVKFDPKFLLLESLKDHSFTDLLCILNTHSEIICPEIFHIALSKHTPQIFLEKLISEGYDLDELDTYDRSPLAVALLNNCNYDTIKYLLNNNADPNIGTLLPIEIVCAHKMSRRVAKLLISNGSNITPSLLHYSIEKNGNDSKTINYIIRNILRELPLTQKDLMNTKDSYGNTPIHVAIKTRANYDTLSMLIKMGADLNEFSNDGHTPLTYSIKHKLNINTIEALLEGGAIANMKNARGNTPLHYLYINGLNLKYLLLLFKYGASVFDTNSNTGITHAEYIHRYYELLIKNKFQ